MVKKYYIILYYIILYYINLVVTSKGVNESQLFWHRAVFLNIYRPHKYCTDFLEDLVESLSLICTDFKCVLIVGDFNIHVDKLEDRWTKELFCVLDNFGLTQHMTQPTHNRGHILEWLSPRVWTFLRFQYRMLLSLIIIMFSLTAIYLCIQIFKLRSPQKVPVINGMASKQTNSSGSEKRRT